MTTINIFAGNDTAENKVHSFELDPVKYKAAIEWLSAKTGNIHRLQANMVTQFYKEHPEL